jgi:hypothetical protein
VQDGDFPTAHSAVKNATDSLPTAAT